MRAPSFPSMVTLSPGAARESVTLLSGTTVSILTGPKYLFHTRVEGIFFTVCTTVLDIMFYFFVFLRFQGKVFF